MTFGAESLHKHVRSVSSFPAITMVSGFMSSMSKMFSEASACRSKCGTLAPCRRMYDLDTMLHSCHFASSPE